MVKAWMLLPATSPFPARPRTPSVSVRRLGRQEGTLQCMQATIQWRWASDERGVRVERVVGAAAPEATSSPQPHGDECTRRWGVAWFWQVRAVLEEGRLDQQQGVQEECIQGRASAAGCPGCISVAVLKSFSICPQLRPPICHRPAMLAPLLRGQLADNCLKLLARRVV